MKKVVWLDIGTHRAQEYSSVFGKNLWFFRKVTTRFVASILRLKNRKPLSIPAILKLMKKRQTIRKNRDAFSFIFVEPNAHVISKSPVYSNANMIFQVALAGDGFDDDFKLLKLFIANGNKYSQGSSIYEAKHNISRNDYLVVPKISAVTLMSNIKESLDAEFEDYTVLLRLNCEGAEDDVIYAAKEIFDNRLELIMGSLKDVAQIKGSDALSNLHSFMSDNNIEFSDFSPDVASWGNAFESIQKTQTQ